MRLRCVGGFEMFGCVVLVVGLGVGVINIYIYLSTSVTRLPRDAPEIV